MVKSFHIFDDEKGLNVLFITSDDNVYGFGQNSFGCCGLGHNSVVNEPQVIPELCHKNIKQFFIGWTLVLALSWDGKVFSWGSHFKGESLSLYNTDLEFQKPRNIYFSDNVIQLSCGSHHGIAKTSDGLIYGFGLNNYGQTGVGKRGSNRIRNPESLKKLKNIDIKSLHCVYERSFALTTDGFVYSWGHNGHQELGHDLGWHFNVYEPKLIDNLSNIICIASEGTTTYFLTNDGLIYFCGELYGKPFQITPKIIKISQKFDIINSSPNYRDSTFVAIGINREGVFHLNLSNVRKTDSKSYFQFLSINFQTTHKTIELSFDDIFDHLFQKRNEINILEVLEKRSKFNQIFRKKKLKAFHVFDDKKGSNGLFITSDDKVYGFGSNLSGCCGLGHNNFVDKPEVIPELCHKNIKQFFIGWNFYLAQDNDNHIYCWGCNYRGQLGKGFLSSEFDYWKPKIIEFSKSIKIKEMSCGSFHTLVLTDQMDIYEWGDNRFRQIGCGKDKGENVLLPTKINLKKSHKIESLFSCFERSFALTSNRLVFCWGHNVFNNMGQDWFLTDFVYEPKMVDMSNVICISFTGFATYFLKNDGKIYFLGWGSKSQMNMFDKSPQQFGTDANFELLHFVVKYKENEAIVLAKKRGKFFKWLIICSLKQNIIIFSIITQKNTK